MTNNYFNEHILTQTKTQVNLLTLHSNHVIITTQ